MAESHRYQSRAPGADPRGSQGRSSAARPAAVADLPAAVELPLVGLRSAGNGALLDHADEVSAALDAAIGFGGDGGFSQRYRSNLQAELDRDRYYAGRYPRVWQASHGVGAVGGTMAAFVGDAPMFFASKLLPGSVVAAANARRAVPFIREGYGTMGAVGGGLLAGAGQVADDAGKGRTSSIGDVGRASFGGAVAGWEATHGRPILGAAVSSGVTTALQQQAHQGSISPADVFRSFQSGAYAGQLLSGLGKYGSATLPSQAKGLLGEGLTFMKSYARGEPIPLRPTPSDAVARRLPGLAAGTAGGQQTIRLSRGKTVADWVTSQGRALEAKFGAYARPTEPQKRAARELGDAFAFDHWLPKNAGEVVSALFGAPTGHAAGRPTRER
jgi:hypothetical protein